MKNIVSCIAALSIVFSCNNKAKEQGTAAEITTAAVDSAKVTFFPVTSFLKGQLLVLDSLPVTVLQIKTIAGKADSTWLKKENIRPALQPFIAQEITADNLTSFFKQTKFNDQTVEAITFTYDPVTTIPDSISIRHWDVYIHPETGKIKRVYLLKQLTEKDKKYTQQLTWETDKWAKIVTILNMPDGSSKVENETKLVWNFNE
jgi:hypothetical protein